MTETFAIVPAGTRPFWIIVPVAILLLAVLGLLFATIGSSRSARFELSPAGLRLRGDLYGRFIPSAELDGARARRVNLVEERELAPRWRTLGTGLPGYRAGWFRLANGEKALLYLTDQRSAVYVPTRSGYSVLVSPQEPDRFVAALKRIAPGR